MLIDYVRVYQADDDDAHVGQAHSRGCDPVGYPTREYIKGHEWNYMRSKPFVDERPLTEVRNGGGSCSADEECGVGGRCKALGSVSFWSSSKEKVCQCRDKEYTGPHCRSHFAEEDEMGAFDYVRNYTWFLSRFVGVYVPVPFRVMGSMVVAIFLGSFVVTLQKKRLSKGSSYKGLAMGEMTPHMGRTMRGGRSGGV
jgi:hypothetical protein